MKLEKITSPGQLEELSGQLLAQEKSFTARVLICMTGCRALGAAEVAEAFREKVANTKLEKDIDIVDVGCIGMCSIAPAVLIEPANYLYGGVKPEDIDDIIELTIKNGKPVERLCVNKDGKPVAEIKKVDFYKDQHKLVLENCGQIDPQKITHAIAHGAYEAAIKTITEETPEQVIEDMIDSGLRGRGGAGFPTGVKWKFARQSLGDEKYLICNADEGDPGAFMDRALLEGDPHKVIEGILIASYAIGANNGFIYVRAEYPIAVEHINIAIGQARQLGLLGKNIAGTDHSFDIEVRIGAGAFVCGEETALINSLEGKRGMPRPRPPFPAQNGYLGKPTNINNVETFASVPVIMKKHAKWFSELGTELSSGTKIFALAGKVKNTGLVEVPMGTTLREIVFDIGGGIENDKEFKAAQMGGPSGGCIPARYLNSEIDYDSVQQIGAIMGSGGLIVMDESTCMVDIARYFLDFTQSESCGKCTPCRVGTKKMLKILEAICSGNAEMKHIEELETLGENIIKGSLCGLGQTAPNPVLSTLKNFREEYEAHITDKKCPAGVCHALLSYIITEKCVGCGACKRVCPVDAITGERKELHAIDAEVCIKCGQCFEVCKFDAIKR